VTEKERQTKRVMGRRRNGDRGLEKGREEREREREREKEQRENKN
jgi:hypothetical protein